MFVYLFLAAAFIAPLETTTVDPELQEIITLFTSADVAEGKYAEIAVETVIETAVVPQQAPIVITNAIDQGMLAYKHWTGTYTPELFTLKVNGTDVALGEKHELPAATTTVELRYDYSFMKGMRTGAKKVSYQLNENVTHANITFSWKDNWKVLVDNATAVKQEEAV